MRARVFVRALTNARTLQSRQVKNTRVLDFFIFQPLTYDQFMSFFWTFMS